MARVTRQMKALYGLCAVALVERRADLDGADGAGFDIDLPIFSVGLAAQLADIHPQTLRQYDRLELVVPQRTEGGARRYSLRDIDRLAQAQRLSQDEGVNLAGVSRILQLEEENRQLRREVGRLKRDGQPSVFAADKDGDITEVQRSAQARRWRREIQHRVRELPSRSYGHDVSPSDGQISGHDVHSQGSGPNSEANSYTVSPTEPYDSPVENQAMVLWKDFLD